MKSWLSEAEMTDPLQTYLGIKTGTVLAGFAGGLVRVLIAKNVTFMQALLSCIVGAITAGYFTPVAMHWLPLAEVSGAEGAIGYAIGLTAMLICEGLLRAAARWRDDPRLPPGP
jgi:hypothetical protein